MQEDISSWSMSRYEKIIDGRSWEKHERQKSSKYGKRLGARTFRAD